MIILGIDTTTKICEVTLKINDNYSIKRVDEGLVHSDKLIFTVEKVFRENNINSQNIDKIVVNIGPGTFTGIRVGVSFARAFSQICNIKIIPIIALDLIKFIFSYKNKILDYDYIAVLLDALRNEFYAKIYNIKNKKRNDFVDYKIFNAKELVNELEKIDKLEKLLVLKHDKIKNFNIESDDKMKIINFDENEINNEMNDAYLIKFAETLDSKSEKNYFEVKPFYIRKTFAEEMKKSRFA
ncbi:MAG: tRNA (adenosine(37)-N6)-threonylcarbamoyltransferase complex dimerization subunit type 1 TsaB [Elusimicrobiota bacterium]|jgi:tRNA threonylcarbamoyl adenosine modification protein YeaZ|nr:tRNA (adenosine(37)-N6)-threonylcarbamoyltransferase complex dimerization subunit type 1 TsaB [Elusimicrobiota bacterium]